MGQNTYSSAFTQADLIAADTGVVQGVYVRLGAYVVKAGEIVTVGAGHSDSMADAIGRIFGKMADNTASPGNELKGKIRLSIQSAQDQPIEIIKEFRTELLNTNATDRTKQTPLPMYDGFVSRDKKIVLEFMSDTTATLGKANSSILLDCTKVNI